MACSSQSGTKLGFGSCAAITSTAIRGASSGTGMIDGPVSTASGIRWQNAKIVAMRQQTKLIRSLYLSLPEPFEPQAGQHVDLRLTAPNGYRAMRSYSIASGPEDRKSVV